MKFSEYSDFDDFCIKNNMTPIEGWKFLNAKLKKSGEESNGIKAKQPRP